ncbi:pisatin demethylase [Stemphylium lycopersici]|uniref:Pisatin demethylase n=1 Tax=Stemphylium lycopersici TaxID=183478 RepID=A0A364NBU3_STELY|nr:pisatin demethylase [Stemphylium lycopersici]
MYLGDLEVAQSALHKQYGQLLRIAPNEVVSSDPNAIRLIYSTKRPLIKTDWYTPFRPRGISEHADLFTEQDEQKHARHHRIVQPVYQMTSILQNEDAIDGCTMLLMQKLKELAVKKNVDLGHWIELYAYETIGHVIFGRTLGFLESGTDVDSFIEAVDNCVPFLHMIAVAPSYIRSTLMLVAMCIPGMLKRLLAIRATTTEAKHQTQVRLQRSTEETENHNDILSQLLRTVHEKGAENDFTHKEVTLESWAGIMAGSDSTASNMRAVLYYLMKHPSAMHAAVQELQAQDHLLSKPVTYAESTTHLPYISACIKETSRLFSSVAVSMSRVSPAQGIMLSNHHIPAGYHVGVNPHTVQHDTAFFGEDAALFRPERWLESQARNFEMEKGMAFFGAGTRTCIGKNVSMPLIVERGRQTPLLRSQC